MTDNPNAPDEDGKTPSSVTENAEIRRIIESFNTSRKRKAEPSKKPFQKRAKKSDISGNKISVNETNSNITDNITQSNRTTGKVVENLKKYPCKYCEKSYTQSHSRKTHMTNVHKTAV